MGCATSDHSPRSRLGLTLTLTLILTLTLTPNPDPVPNPNPNPDPNSNFNPNPNPSQLRDTDSVLGAWARLIFAPVATLCMPSTFCMWPTLSAVGRGHFVASPVWPNASGMAAVLAAEAGDRELRDLDARDSGEIARDRGEILRDSGEILRDRFRVITEPPFVSYDSLPRGVRKSGIPNP